MPKKNIKKKKTVKSWDVFHENCIISTCRRLSEIEIIEHFGQRVTM